MTLRKLLAFLFVHGTCSKGFMASTTGASFKNVEDSSLVLLQHRASMQNAAQSAGKNAETGFPKFLVRAARQATQQRQDNQIWGQCGIIWYYHIPKCAGTSVETWFRALVDTHQVSAVIPLHTRGPNDDLRDFQQLTDNEMVQNGPLLLEKWHAAFIEDFLQNPAERTIVVHHHDRGPGLAGMEHYFTNLRSRLQAKGCGFWKLTFLRNPVDLTTSALFYYDHAEFFKPRIAPSIVQYRERNQTLRFINALETDKWYDNMLIRYLLNNKNDWSGPMPRNNGAKYPIPWGGVNTTHLKLAEDILQDFDFVGIAEDIVKGKQQIAEVIHLTDDREGLEKDNAYEHPEYEQLSGYLKQMIWNRTQLDRQLYQTLYKSGHNSQWLTVNNPFRLKQPLELGQVAPDIASQGFPSTQDEPTMQAAILSKIERTTEALLFFAIDQNHDDLISIDECENYLSNPHTMQCLSAMGFLSAVWFGELAVTPLQVCQILQIPEIEGGGIDMSDFTSRLGRLQNNQGELLAEIIFSRDLLSTRRGEGSSTHTQHLEEAMHEKDCQETHI